MAHIALNVNVVQFEKLIFVYPIPKPVVKFLANNYFFIASTFKGNFDVRIFVLDI